jgi:hypothetical protein
MLTSPYQTTICAIYQPDRLVNAVKRADIEYPLPELVTPAGNTIQNAFFVTPRDVHDDVPAFTQMLNLGTDTKPKLVIDARPYMRWDNRMDTYRLTAENDYSFQCARVALTVALMDGDSRMLNRMGDIPVKVFVRWITLTLAQRFNLPLENQLTLSVICAYYYYGMISDSPELDEEERTRLAPFVSRVTMVPANQVLEIADRLQPMRNAGDLAVQLSTNGGTIRLGQLKFVDLFTLLASSWVGVNSRENVGVALEHIPTFIAMIYAALGDRSYRKTVMTKRAETVARPNDVKQFTDLVYRQISAHFK